MPNRKVAFVLRLGYIYCMHDRYPENSRYDGNNQILQDTQIKPAAEHPLPKVKKRRGLIVLVTLLGLILLAGGILLFKNYNNHRQLIGTIPLSIRQDVDFPIYIPSQKQYWPNKSSFNYSEGVLVFLVQSNGLTLAFTEQKKPQDFVLSNFATSQDITETRQQDLGQDKALFGKVHGKELGIVETDLTIITAVVTSPSSEGSLQTILHDLSQVKPTR